PLVSTPPQSTINAVGFFSRAVMKISLVPSPQEQGHL
ncbi:MAG: hypothetical protein RLY68_381, partial [Actinomycetota bacterium]